ncbi:MAG: DEAD/DEAH box helicase, partial [Acidimicrobiales bacterium]
MLAEELEAVLGRRPGLTAPELADLMGMGPGPGLRSVAFALYAGHGRFRCDGAEPPRWWLAGEGGAGPGGHGPLVGTQLWRNSGCSSEDPAPTPAGGPQGPSPSSPLALWPWQAEALGAWSRAGGRGVVEAVTGTGKTRLGVAAALQEIGRRGQVLVLVPTVELQHQWVGELAARLPPGSLVGRLGAGGADTLLTHDVVVAVVNSARDLDVRPIRRGGLLLADECHRYGSEVNRLALDGRFARRLGLSATYARDDDGHLAWLDPYFGPTCFRMGYR